MYFKARLQNCESEHMLCKICMYVYPSAWNTTAPTGRIFMKFHIWVFFEYLYRQFKFNPLNAELNPICCLLPLLGAHHFLHVSRIRVKSLTLRLLMSYIYDISRLRVHPNVLPSVCKFEIRSTAINILSVVPVRRTGFKGKERKPYFLRVGDAQWKTQQDPERKIVCREMLGREASNIRVRQETPWCNHSKKKKYFPSLSYTPLTWNKSHHPVHLLVYLR